MGGLSGRSSGVASGTTVISGGAISIFLEAFINPCDAILVEEFTYIGSL